MTKTLKVKFNNDRLVECTILKDDKNTYKLAIPGDEKNPANVIRFKKKHSYKIQK